MIVQKLGTKAISLSYSEVAKTAYEVSRPQLAILLLEYEHDVAQQVPLLLSMSQDSQALRKSLQSGDTDLIYLTILHLSRKTNSTGELFRILNTDPYIGKYLEVYCRLTNNMDLLRDYYYQEDERMKSAMELLKEACNEKEVTQLMINPD